jgi:hypothetical protein
MIARSQRPGTVAGRWSGLGVRRGVLRSLLLGVAFGGSGLAPLSGFGAGAAIGAGVASGAGAGAGVGVGAGASAFPALETAHREQVALGASAGVDPARRPTEEVRAVATRWNAAAREASRVRLSAPLLREQWNLVVNAAAEAWSEYALVIGTPVPADSLAYLSGEALALSDDAAAILPAIRAASSGKRAALLLTTSVGCECTMQRAAQMEEVWTALAGPQAGSASLVVAMAGRDGIGAPIRDVGGDAPGVDLRSLLGRSDLAASPDLPDAFGIDRVPGWLLLEPGGGIADRVDGGEGVPEIAAVIRRWLGGEGPGR